ncbi:M20/M25/M40 family metallo-hydrolase [Streptomyces sp. NPDC049541]|uniref:M20/M25/M40 family metallo-hydrolase n=1 Tax=Streptomyces sp. NPDC049541 TaxID=3365594 RepID=UPI0037A42DA8
MADTRTTPRGLTAFREPRPPAPGPRHPSRTVRALARLLVPVLALAAALVGVLWTSLTPAPAPKSAPADSFSAARAYPHVAAVAGSPHATGTADHDRVRDELLRRLRQVGLDARIEPGTSSATGHGAAVAAWVQNISATLHGTHPSGRLLIVAHYDSEENSHGASDDGIGFATLLEVARALKAGPAPRNDITFLITDGEEPGLLGARAFVARDTAPAASTVVLNLEARGTSGRTVMFESGSGNAALVPALRGRPAVVTSLSDEVYRMLPNDTDFTVLRKAGMTGMNFAVIGASANYHTPQDDLADFSRRSLQDMGDTVLAAARRLGGADLSGTRHAGRATYFTLGPVLVRYPMGLVLPGAVLAVAVLGAALWYAGRRGALRPGRTAISTAALPLAPLGAAGAASLVWPVATWLRPQWTGFALGSPYRPGPLHLAAVLLTATALWVWAVVLRRRATALEVSAAATAWLTLCAVLTAVWLPGASYLFLWPALTGAAGLAAAARAGSGSVWRGALATAPLVPCAALLVPVGELLFDTVPVALAAAPALLLALAFAPALPAVPRRTRRRWAVGATALGTAGALSALGVAVLTGAPTASRPAQVSLVYALDADTGRARWASSGAGSSGWLDHYVGAATGSLEDVFPSLDQPARWHTGAAPAATVPVPVVKVVAAARTGDVRRITLSVAATGPRAAEIDLYADAGGATVVRATVAGQRIPGGVNRPFAHGGWRWGLLLTAPPAGPGTQVQLEVRGAQPLRLRAVTRTPGLPEGTLSVPRPATVTWSADNAGLTLVSRRYVL